MTQLQIIAIYELYDDITYLYDNIFKFFDIAT